MLASPAVTADGAIVCPLCADELGRLIRGQLMAEAAERCAGALPDVTRFVDALVPVVTEDLHALVAGDPASRGSCRYVLASYQCFRAVLTYRVTHALVETADGLASPEGDPLRISARCLSERAKVQTGIEIHPDAVIGRRFVVDHGVGTVIGQTVHIGEDCYILQNVILGSTGIAGNATGRRHPTLGSRVEVGAFARVLGPVHVGDEVLIGPHCVVTSDVRGGSRVVVRNQYEVVSPNCRMEVFGTVPRVGGGLEIHGSRLSDVTISIVDSRLRALPRYRVEVQRASDQLVECLVVGEQSAPRDVGLLLTDASGESLAVMRTPLFVAGPADDTACSA